LDARRDLVAGLDGAGGADVSNGTLLKAEPARRHRVTSQRFTNWNTG
jgi:hypothetical protein